MNTINAIETLICYNILHILKLISTFATQQIKVNMTNIDIDKHYNQWEQSLWQKYNEIFNNAKYTITDGVISPSAFFNSELKVMFLNREPYDDDGYSLNHAIQEAIIDNRKIFPNGVWLHKNLHDQLAILSLLTDKCFIHLTEDDATQIVQSWDMATFQKYFNNVAYANIKKSDGMRRSNINDLKIYLQKGVSILKEQILYFNPSIIMGGNIVDGIMECCDIEFGDTLYTNSGIINVYQLIINGKTFPIMDLNHPSTMKYRNGSMSNYYLEVFQALQSIEKQYPGFWKNRMKQSCFNL